MEIIPEIEVKNGRSVWRTQPRAEQANLLIDDPLKIAKRWRDEGATRLHLIDLDGMRVGMPQNREIIRDLVRRIGIPVQISGGIPTLDVADRLFAMGVERVVLSPTKTAEGEMLEMLRQHTRKIVIEIDVINGQWVPEDAISARYGGAAAIQPAPSAMMPSSLPGLGARPPTGPLLGRVPPAILPNARPIPGAPVPPVIPATPPPRPSEIPAGFLPVADYVAAVKAMGARVIIVRSVTPTGEPGALHQDLAELGRRARASILVRGEIARYKALEVLQAAGIEGLILGKPLYDNTIKLPDALTTLSQT